MAASGFALAVAGGVCGAALTQAATFLRDWLNKGEEGRFTALLLALQLEDYAANCREPIATLNDYVASKYITREPTGSIPSLPPFPEKINWRSLGVHQASEVLGFRVRVDSTHAGLHAKWEHEGKVSAWGEASDKAVELGNAALEIARALRISFSLPSLANYDDTDLFGYFEQEAADLRKRRAAMRAQLDEMFSQTTP